MGGEEDGEVASLFVRDGLLFPVPVLTAEEADFYRLKYEDYVRRYGGGGNRVRGNKIFRLHLLAPWAARLVRHNRQAAGTGPRPRPLYDATPTVRCHAHCSADPPPGCWLQCGRRSAAPPSSSGVPT